MSKYPVESHFKQWEITKEGDEAQLRFMNRDQEDSLVTLPYEQLRATAQQMLSALLQATATRLQHGKPLNHIPAALLVQPPIATAGNFQMHIAADRGHVLLEFQSAVGLTLQLGMPVTQAAGIARKVLQDLDTYQSRERQH